MTGLESFTTVAYPRIKFNRLFTSLTLGLGVVLGLFALIGRAAPGRSPVGAYAHARQPNAMNRREYQ